MLIMALHLLRIGTHNVVLRWRVMELGYLMITGCTILSRLTQNFETKPSSLIPVNLNKPYEKEAPYGI